MRGSLLAILAAVAAAASSAFDSQIIFKETEGERISSVFDGDGYNATYWVQDGRDFTYRDGSTYEVVKHPAFDKHRLRIVEPKICDPTVKQYSGYFDVGDGKHLFFWFFESRHSPETSDFLYWTNGGPGGSSLIGLLFELGPCRIADKGKNVTRNPYSWNENFNILFVDQPVGVGFSYQDLGGPKVDRSWQAGEDMYAFFQLFFSRFPEYADSNFHMAGESYGGTYIPNSAAVVHKHNKALDVQPIPGLRKLNLASVILANGLSDPYVQFAAFGEWLCEGPYAIFDDPGDRQCRVWRSKAQICSKWTQACYTFGTRFVCGSAEKYCWDSFITDFQKFPINMYDLRKACDRSPDKDGPLCYKEAEWMPLWLNRADVKKEVGANPAINFTSMSQKVNKDFLASGDLMHYSAGLLTNLVDDGIRLLVYAGETDAACNALGQSRWVEKFPSVFHREYSQTPTIAWRVRSTGEVAGSVRTVGGDGSTAGNITFVTIYEAGHMAPYDKPAESLEMITRWVENLPLT